MLLCLFILLFCFICCPLHDFLQPKCIIHYIIIKLVMKISDSLDREQTSYNLSSPSYNQNPKYAMQTLYRQQLDSLMHQKMRQKQAEKARQQNQKRQFNQRAYNNKQSQKIKQQAYKNYYNMLLTNQQQLQSSYISPFSIRDSMKDQHIATSVEQGQQRMRQWDMEEKRRQAEMRNGYREGLMNQIEERRRLESERAEEERRRKEEFRRYGKLPDQIGKYERQRQLEEMSKYRQDLDKVKNDKDYFRTRTMSEQQSVRLPNDHHNALINPLPYNIQNPYILRQMNRQSYLASQANQNGNSNRQ